MLGNHSNRDLLSLESSKKGIFLDGIVKEDELQREVERLRSGKRRRTHPPGKNLSYTDLYDFMKEFDIFSRTSLQYRQLNHLDLPLEEFQIVVEKAKQHKDTDWLDFIRNAGDTTLINNIVYLLQQSPLTVSDVLHNVKRDFLALLITTLCRGGDIDLAGRFLEPLSQSGKVEVLMVLMKESMVDGCVAVAINEIMGSMPGYSNAVVEFITKFVSEGSVGDIYDLFKRLPTLEECHNFQQQLQQLRYILKSLCQETMFKHVMSLIEIGQVTFEKVVLCVRVLVETDDVAMLNRLVLSVKDGLEHAIASKISEKFILSLIFLRLLDLLSIESYLESYKIAFGQNSTVIKSSKNVEFILNEFIKLIPYENGRFLKHHLSQPLKGGAKLKDKLDEYLLLGKTRLKDFNLEAIDKNIVNEVTKCVQAYVRLQKVPSSILEASIFKKQYYNNHFLPCLLHSKELAELNGRNELVEALIESKKIPPKLLKKPDEVMEIEELPPIESLRASIDSLSTVRFGEDYSKAMAFIRSQIVTTKDTDIMRHLIVTLCSKATFIDHIQELKKLHNIVAIAPCLQHSISTLIEESPSAAYFGTMSIFDDDTQFNIIKRLIKKKSCKGYGYLSQMNEGQQRKFLYLRLLTRSLHPQDVTQVQWQELSLSKFCEALSWLVYTDFSSFHTYVTLLLDKIAGVHAPAAFCKSIFRSCLKYDILGLVSQSLIPVYRLMPPQPTLWVYEILAEVLLPLYQTTGLEKPAITITRIFRNFFGMLTVLDPSLLYRSSSGKCLDNVLSVVDSYKRYITTGYTIQLTILMVIIKAMEEDRETFSLFLGRSVLFRVSCVHHYTKLKHFRLVTTSKKISELLSSSNSAVSNLSAERGVCQCLAVYYSNISSNEYFETIKNTQLPCYGYIITELHVVSEAWIHSSLTTKHLQDVGRKIFDASLLKYFFMIIAEDYRLSDEMKSVFEGYRSQKVIALVCLGAVAFATSEAVSMAISQRLKDFTRLCYKQAQRVVFDQAETMQAMQRFVRGFVTATTTSQPLNCSEFVATLANKCT